MRRTKIFAVLVVGILVSTLSFLAVRAEKTPEEPRHDLASSVQSRLSSRIQYFTHMPSQSAAEELVRTLEDQEVSAEQGGEILSILTAPRAWVRSAYSVDMGAAYVVTYPAQFHFRNMVLRSTRKRFVNGVEYNGDHATGGNIWAKERIGSIDPHSIVVAGQLKGVPQTVLVVDQEMVEVIPGEVADREQSPALYSCTSRLFVPIHFVADSAAESVHVFTSPELDEKMRSAFDAVQGGGVGSDGKLNIRVSRTISLSYRRLPADVAFKKMFRDEQGHLLEIFEDTPWTLLKAHAGTSGDGSFFPLNHNIEKFPLAKGRHEGHLVLVPCPEGAYYDPRLTHIWGGTLEFPMTLTVDDRD